MCGNILAAVAAATNGGIATVHMCGGDVARVEASRGQHLHSDRLDSSSGTATSSATGGKGGMGGMSAMDAEESHERCKSEGNECQEVSGKNV